MTRFKTADELETRTVNKPVSTLAEMWAMEARLIRDLADHPGLYAMYPKTFDTYQAASRLSKTITDRVRYSFCILHCSLTGGFPTRITEEDDGTFRVWVAYVDTPIEEDF